MGRFVYCMFFETGSVDIPFVCGAVSSSELPCVIR